MKLKSTILLLSLMMASPSFAAKYYYTLEQQCSSVDFRESFPMKIRDQGKSGWCFANSAADYLQYAYRLPEPVSAADIAINYSQSNISKLMQFFKKWGSSEARAGFPKTGFIKVAINKIIPQGYCPEAALPSDFWNKTDVATGKSSSVEILDSALEAFDLQKQIHAGNIKTPADMPSYFTFKNINRDQFFDILKNSSKKSMLSTLRASACKNERKSFGSEWIGSDFQVRGRHVFQNMNYAFDQGMPVTIDFFSDLIYNYRDPARKLSDMHTVLVYGRKFDPKTEECQYMIKDSHGTDCDRYDSGVTCEGGYLWIPEQKLFRAMTSQLILYR